MIEIRRASHLGFCFGVRDAIALAETEASRGPATILGDLVHNPAVLESLREKGVRIAHSIAEVETDRLIITAHGTSDRNREALRRAGFDALDATCPLVRHAHHALRRLVDEGFHPVVIGKRGHIEVRGLTGDFDGCEVIQNEADITAITPRKRFGVVAQTTQPIARVKHLVGMLRRAFPEAEVRFEDTVCHPTKLRQEAVKNLSQSCDVVLVVGGRDSNNTAELVRAAALFTPRVHHVQDASELQCEWLAHANRVGITAGTSTPDHVIDAVEQRVRELTLELPVEATAELAAC